MALPGLLLWKLPKIMKIIFYPTFPHCIYLLWWSLLCPAPSCGSEQYRYYGMAAARYYGMYRYYGMSRCRLHGVDEIIDSD